MPSPLADEICGGGDNKSLKTVPAFQDSRPNSEGKASSWELIAMQVWMQG